MENIEENNQNNEPNNIKKTNDKNFITYFYFKESYENLQIDFRYKRD